MLLYSCEYDKEDNKDSKDNTVSKADRLYKELTGIYKIVKSQLTYTDQTKLILEPPDINGTMTITSSRKITQKLTVYNKTVEVKGTYEINPDEGIMLVNNEPSNVKSSMAYTWDGEILTTTVILQTLTEKDFWRQQ